MAGGGKINKNHILLIIENDADIKKDIAQVFLDHGYITEEKELTEKALNLINKKFDTLELGEAFYEALKKLFKNNGGTVNSYATCKVHYKRMIKQFCNKHTQHLFTEPNFIKAAENWIRKVQYIGEMKYFFHKDKTSRCFDNLTELELQNKVTKEFKER